MSYSDGGICCGASVIHDNKTRCRHLALSTNNIEKISSLSGMENLKILSLGRNVIKKIENLDAVAETLEELWISYNVLTSLAGADKAPNLRVLYASNNKIAGWNEIDRLASLAHLEDLLLVGNPLYNDYKDNNALSEYRVEVIKRLPNLKKLDGIPVDVDEREQASLSK
uniref:Dynein axonemal light chain 1 n=1 Tax=Dunaliella tertiolecta TaxID=3047 RepID=A0A7S3QY02_DUNTE